MAERSRLAQLQSEGLSLQLLVGKRTEGDGGFVLQQHSFHARSVQPGQLTTRMAAAFLVGVQGELLDLGTPDRRVQIVMQAGTPRLTEEYPGELLQLRRAQGFGATGQLVATIEQPIDVLLDVALALADRLGIAEQEQYARPRLDLATGHAMKQLVEQLDGCGFVAVDTRRQQQIQAVVLAFGRAHLEGALPQPAQTHALDRHLRFLGRFMVGQGQVKQFSEGEHRAFP